MRRKLKCIEEFKENLKKYMGDGKDLSEDENLFMCFCIMDNLVKHLYQKLGEQEMEKALNDDPLLHQFIPHVFDFMQETSVFRSLYRKFNGDKK